MRSVVSQTRPEVPSCPSLWRYPNPGRADPLPFATHHTLRGQQPQKTSVAHAHLNEEKAQIFMRYSYATAISTLIAESNTVV